MALKREQTASMFDGLKNTTVKSVEKEQPKTTSIESDLPKTTLQKSVDVKEEKQVNNEKAQKKAEEKTAEEKKAKIEDKPKTTPIKKSVEKTPAQTTEIKGFDFGGVKTKENKSIRKQFVLTPTYAEWLKKTAKLNGISENAVIENLIKMAMDMQ